jgi:beta-phosphoglucomutase-like phosphatase (HAD superfamily)/ADP-ribose pyrophosphatase YjhB (NUDIX family)
MKDITELDLSQYQLVIFDWDGTLVDSSNSYIELDKRFVTDFYGINNIKQLDNIEYKPTDRWWKDKYYRKLDILFGDGNAPFSTIYAKLNSHKHNIQSKIDYWDEADVALKRLRSNTDLRLALATNSDMDDMDFFSSNESITAHKLTPCKFFDAVATIDDVDSVKPDPEIYEKIIERFGFDRKKVLVFEDTLNGLRAAKLADVKTVFVDMCKLDKNPDIKIRAVADYHLRDWRDLIKLINKNASRKPDFLDIDPWQGKRTEMEIFDLRDRELPEIDWHHVLCLGNLDGKIPLVYYDDYPCGLPGGHIDSTDKNVEEALRRELREEMNCEILEWKPLAHVRLTKPDGQVVNQLRVYANLRKTGEFMRDPGGLVTGYKLHDIDKYVNLVNHGKTGDWEYNAVKEYYK